MIKVKELKQYIQWLIDNDMDEYNYKYRSPSSYNGAWRYEILKIDNLKIVKTEYCYEVFDYNGDHISVYEKYINEWRVINRKKKLERIVDERL